MPNFRPVDRNLKFIAVDFEAQLLPGTFEHALSGDNQPDFSMITACEGRQIPGKRCPRTIVPSGRADGSFYSFVRHRK